MGARSAVSGGTRCKTRSMEPIESARLLRVAAYQGAEQPDLVAALDKIAAVASAAAARQAEIVCFPECFLTGYFTDAESAAPHAIAFDGEAFDRVLSHLASVGPTLIVGLVERVANGSLFNTAAVIAQGQLRGIYRKRHVNERGFEAGSASPVFDVGAVRIGVNICNDANYPDPAKQLAKAGAAVIFCPLNNLLKRQAAEVWRHRHIENLVARARETGCWVVSADVIGESDARVGYGFTAIVDPSGEVRCRSVELEEDLLVADVLAVAPA